ncbi:MAG: UDP-N-acetylmuramate--L-alanine ligase [Nakamurella sp.]
MTESGAELSRAHLVGAGGAGMSAIATVLLDRGALVSGSDAKGSHALTGLKARGALIAVGQRAENLDLMPGGPTAVVVSTAIRPDNPEVLEAQRRGLPIVRRADALAALMVGSRSVCIAGTHGKTSTTSMLTVALQNAGLDPSFAIGGELNESGTGAHAGSGDVFIAEADESDGSFLAFSPLGAVITTIEPDHLDHHGTPEAYAAVFTEFVARIRPGGFLVVGIDDPGVQALLVTLPHNGYDVSRGGASPTDAAPHSADGPHSADRPHSADGPHAADKPVRVVTYGRAADATVRIVSTSAHGHSTGAELALADGRTVTIEIDVPGDHMVANAAAVLAVGLELGVSPAAMVRGLAAFSGVRRRFEFRGRSGDVRLFDDYAHHPTEVAATLAAARSVAGVGRVVVIFQPHLYSRTATFASAFATALAAADVVFVLDVYGAREDPRPGVTGALIADAIDRQNTDVHYVPSLADVPNALADVVRAGDLVLTMGAGDVTLLCPEVLRELDLRGGTDAEEGQV